MIDDTYCLWKQIGFGSSSKVYSAVDCNNNSFAIKIIRKDKGFNLEAEEALVLREYFVMGHIGEHPNIVKHYGCNAEGVL